MYGVVSIAISKVVNVLNSNNENDDILVIFAQRSNNFNIEYFFEFPIFD